MKRLNPETGEPFKCGDVREDGKIFRNYNTHDILKTGFFYEFWQNELDFYRKRTQVKINNRSYIKTPNGRAKKMLANCFSSAKSRNIYCNIKEEDILPALENGYCELTGLPFDFKPPKGKVRNPYAPSIDRINSDKGYTKDNIRVVLWAVNAALSECSDEEMLLILRAMVKAIEKNVNKKSTSPIPKGANIKSTDKSQHGTIPTPGTGEDYYDLDHYCRTVRGEDADYRTKTRGGDGVGYGSTEVAAPETLTRVEDNGQPDAEIIRLDFGSRHLPNKP